MSVRVGFRDAFKVQLMRRLGSWGSRLTADDVEKLLVWAAKVIPNRDVRTQAEKLHHAFTTYDVTAEAVRGFFELAPTVRRRFIENLLVNWRGPWRIAPLPESRGRGLASAELRRDQPDDAVQSPVRGLLRVRVPARR